MNEAIVVELVNGHVPFAASRRRIRLSVGARVMFRNCGMLSVERERTGDERRIVFNWLAADLQSSFDTDAARPVFLGEHNGCRVVTRAVYWRGDAPIGVLVELQADPRKLLSAIEAAA